jgi:hypothetical protein
MDEETTDKKLKKKLSSKKTGADLNERLSRRIDAQEAERYRARRQNVYAAHGLKPQTKDLKIGLKKIRNKIRDPFDEDEDDENDYIISPIFQQQEEEPSQGRNLFDALTTDEKRMLRQQETDQTIKMQQNAGKMEALLLAEKLAQETANRSIGQSVLDREMQRAVFDPDAQQEKLIRKEVGSRLGLKGHIEDGKIIQAARGIKKVQMMAGNKATKDMDMQDVVRAGEGKMTDKELAELILKKSGQDVSKFESKSSSSKKIQLKHFDIKPKSKSRDT